MDDTERDVTQPGTGGAMGRRSLFAGGAVIALLTLTGCPGGSSGDDDDEGDSDDGDDD